LVGFADVVALADIVALRCAVIWTDVVALADSARTWSGVGAPYPPVEVMMTETGSADFSSVPVDVRDGKLGDQIILGSSGAKENVGRELEGTVGINDGSDMDTLGWIQMLVLVAVTFKMGNCVLRTRGMEVGMAMLLCCGTGSDHSILERTGSWMEWV
jgi:hypothetical protein